MFQSIQIGGERREVLTGSATTPEQQAILAERPSRDGAIDIVLEALDCLSTSRPIGMVVGLIPWHLMREWCRVEGLDDAATGVLVDALKYVDLDEFKKRNTKDAATPRAPARGARR